jgi:uncharacterized protein YcaQ
MLSFTKQEARDYLTRYHQINTKTSLKGKDGILLLMEQLHSLQYDPLDVVGKNTDLTLQSRIQGYKKGDINTLLYKDRSLLDAWDKMMGVIVSKDYPLLEEVRKWRTDLEVNTLKRRLQIDALEYEEDILNLLQEGPKFAKDIRLGATKSHVWGHTKSSTATLDYLFHKGLIGVRSRNNTQKEYDLMERLIPEYMRPNPLNLEDFKDYYLLRRVESLGILRDKKGIHIAGPFIYDNKTRRDIIQSLLQKDLITQVMIEGVKDKCYISNKYKTLDNNIVPKISFLAPLDNMLWDRDLIEDVFDFKYKWEVYTPVIKREYGYYVLPILYKSNFIGRIEFEKHRDNEILYIKNIWLEKDNKSIQNQMTKAIKRFESYLNAQGVLYEDNDYYSR